MEAMEGSQELQVVFPGRLANGGGEAQGGEPTEVPNPWGRGDLAVD